MGTDFRDKLDCEEGLTFDDLLLRPSESTVEPNEADVSTRVSVNVEMETPIISAAMDTVTESGMAIAMAREGGIGVVHRNLSADSQAEEIRKVKDSDRLITRDVVTITTDASVDDATRLMETEDVSGLPVLDDTGDLVGIVSKRDLRPFADTGRGDVSITEVMTRDVVTVDEGIDPDEALELMYENGVERLPVVEDGGETVEGIITMRSILRRREYPDATRDDDGHLAVAAAVSPFKTDRALKLDEAGADVLMVDTAHAHNMNVVEGAREIKQKVDADVVVGNIATSEAAEELVEFADGLKVGVGPGSICTTRVVAGSGMPQMTAISNVADVASEHGVPVIADGGIRYSGDIAKAVAAGADAVMMGSLLAGTDEAPGRTITVQGKRYKQYRGMGSVGAMTAGEETTDRYLKEDTDQEFVPEGIEGAIPYRGSVGSQIHQLVGGLQSGMGYVGASDIDEMQEEARFVRITGAGKEESHPHDVMITDEAPNYRSDQT
ncbi:MAG: IMP dehydrogenase [Halobacteria archaeon]|nr:IMP dehydrogenase [Halobacteria archaeon]